MIERILGKTFLCLPLLTACIATTKQDSGLQAVDDVVVRIEHVHVDTELADEHVSTAIANLMEIVSPDFEGDAVSAHAAFLAVVEGCEDHARQLRHEVQQMKYSAEPFFEKWEMDLRGFAGAEMRQRSRDRMLATKEHYEAIVSASRPMLADYDNFNLSLRDVALFLSHDFNAVADIEPEVQAINEVGAQLKQRIDTTLAATRAYVETSGLPIRVDADTQ